MSEELPQTQINEEDVAMIVWDLMKTATALRKQVFNAQKLLKEAQTRIKELEENKR